MTYFFLAIIIVIPIIFFLSSRKGETTVDSSATPESISPEPTIKSKSAKEKLMEELALKEQDQLELQTKMEEARLIQEKEDAAFIAEISHLEPENSFEKATIALHKQTCDFKSFLEQHFIKTTFLVLTNQKPVANEKGEITEKVNLFKIQKEGKDYICLFSSPDRAMLTRKEQTGYDFSIQAPAPSIVLQSEGACGLVINYGWDTEVVLSAELTAQILEAIQNPPNTANVRFNYREGAVGSTDLLSIEKSAEVIQEMQAKELTLDVLKTFANGDFLKMRFSILLKKKATRKDGLISFDINDILLVAGPKDRPFLALFSDPKFIEHAADEIELLEEVVQITATDVLRQLPTACGILINPGTKLFLPMG